MFEKAKVNYAQKKHLEQKDDQITKLHEQVSMLKI